MQNRSTEYEWNQDRVISLPYCETKFYETQKKIILHQIKKECVVNDILQV